MPRTSPPKHSVTITWLKPQFSRSAPRLTSNPGSNPATAELDAKIAKAKAAAGKDEPFDSREDLQKLRTVPAGSSAGLSGTAEYRLLLSPHGMSALSPAGAPSSRVEKPRSGLQKLPDLFRRIRTPASCAPLSLIATARPAKSSWDREARPETSDCLLGYRGFVNKPALSLVLLFAASPVAAQSHRDLGPNVLLISPSTPREEAQAKINAIYAHATAQRVRLRPQRHPSSLPARTTSTSPSASTLPSSASEPRPTRSTSPANVHVDAASRNNNATTTFWRSAEGFSVTSNRRRKGRHHAMGPSLRRCRCAACTSAETSFCTSTAGWASGRMDVRLPHRRQRRLGRARKQQWISRNSDWASWTGSNWNMVFLGIPHPPAGDWPKPAYTKIERTPIIREKPFLEVDASGRWSVRVPALAANTTGITWTAGTTPGSVIPLARFYIAHPGADTAASINAQLAQGKHLLFTPGIYDLAEPIRITRATPSSSASASPRCIPRTARQP